MAIADLVINGYWAMIIKIWSGVFVHSSCHESPLNKTCYNVHSQKLR